MSPGGSKNASLPVIAATLLIDSPITIEGVPRIGDVETLLEILRELGVSVRGQRGTLVIDSGPRRSAKISAELGSKIRGGYYLLGALAHTGDVSIPWPGGCAIGERPMDLHMAALRQLGADVTSDETGVRVRAKKLHGARIRLPFPSRGATINTALAASRAEGQTVILNANRSPEAVALIALLQDCGVPVETASTASGEYQLVIEGTRDLVPSNVPFQIPVDKIEAAVLIIAGLITGGRVSVRLARNEVESIAPFIDLLRRAGAPLDVAMESGSQMALIGPGLQTNDLNPVAVESGLTPPRIDADWEPPLAALLAACSRGDSVIDDPINPDRHARFLPQFANFGRRVTECSPTVAIVHGERTPVKPGCAECQDIRGGTALLLLALAASGISVLRNPGQLDRGYGDLPAKLVTLGARIESLYGEADSDA